MYGPDNSTAVAARPARAAAGPAGLWFTNGNPATAQQPTSPTADFMNGLVAELLSILSAAGIAPDKTQDAQILAALKVLTLKWLGGGVYGGAPKIISNGVTLTSTNCGFLNCIFNSPFPYLPLASSVPPGTVIDFLSFSNSGGLNAQGSDNLADGAVNATFYAITLGSKFQFMSDGNQTWYLSKEGNLYGPAFRSNPTAPTPSRTDRTTKLQTTSGALALGRRFASQTVLTASTTLTATAAGCVFALSGGAFTITLPSAADPGLLAEDCITIWDTTGVSHVIQAAAGQYLNIPGLGLVSSFTLPPYGSIELYNDGSASWNCSRQPAARPLQLISSTVITSNVAAVSLSVPLGAQRARVEVIGLNGTINPPGQNGGPIISGFNINAVSGGSAVSLYTSGFGSGSTGGSGTPGLSYDDAVVDLADIQMNYVKFIASGYTPSTNGGPRPSNLTNIGGAENLLYPNTGVTALQVVALSGTFLCAGTVNFYA